MSSERSSSAVRNLRTIFENKASERSSFDLSTGVLANDKENDRPKSKIRTSFIPVELQQTMASNGVAAADAVQDDRALGSDTKPSASEELKTSAQDVLGDAVVTGKTTESLRAETTDTPAMNPDKPVMGSEQEAGAMRSADLSDAATVSGKTALSPNTDGSQLRPEKTTAASSAGPTTKKGTSRPSTIGTKTGPRPPSVSKSPRVSHHTAPKGSTPTPASHSTSASRSTRTSLTAPTAASVARAATSERSDVYNPPPKPKPREPTRPMEISARLTAPTAASRARQAAATPAEKASRSSLPSVRPPSSRSAGRASLGPAIRAEGADSFLERMTRPTAASQHRVHDKVEPKSPAKAKPIARRPKAGSKSGDRPIPFGDAASEADQTLLDESIVEPQEDAAAPLVERQAQETEPAAVDALAAQEDLPATTQDEQHATVQSSGVPADSALPTGEQSTAQEVADTKDVSVEEPSVADVPASDLTQGTGAEVTEDRGPSIDLSTAEQDDTEVKETEATPKAAEESTDAGAADSTDLTTSEPVTTSSAAQEETTEID